MEQRAFTAAQLFCMAQISGKENMYGIPNPFEELFERDAIEAINEEYDKLMDLGITSMDFDGNTMLSPDYNEILDFVCECDKCMTLSSKIDNIQSDYVFYKRGNQVLKVEVLGEKYVFSDSSEKEISDTLKSVKIQNTAEGCFEGFEIPNVELEIVQRELIEEDIDAAMRRLLQNGADRAVAPVIANGLVLEADYCMTSIVEPEKDPAIVYEKCLIESNGIWIELCDVVIDYKTSVRFTPADENVDSILQYAFESFC